jgi:sugar lactone lactonase YvrE
MSYSPILIAHIFAGTSERGVTTDTYSLIRWTSCMSLLCAAILFSSLSYAQDAAATPEALNAAAIKAYQAKDYATFLANEKRALTLDPGSPLLIYNVACGEALTGNAVEAFHHLNDLLARKLDLGAETDDDFASIRKNPEWTAFMAKLADLRKPLVHSAPAFTLADPELVATGVAVDPSTGDTFIASVRERKILRRNKSGVVSDFVTEAQDGLMATACVLVDSTRKLLFASTASVPFMRGYRKEDDGKAGVYVFDLRTGKVLRKAWLSDSKKHFLNQLLMNRAGDLFVSDSLTPGIYRMKSGAEQLELIPISTAFRSTQGLAFSDDEKTLYVDDFSNGVWAVGMAAGTRRQLEVPTNTWLGGLDGLSRVADGFIAVQILVRPERVVRLRLDPKWQRIAAVEVLESNHPDYNGPIQGTVDGTSYLYVANSQLGLGNGENGAFAADRAKPTVVLRLPLGESRR